MSEASSAKESAPVAAPGQAVCVRAFISARMSTVGISPVPETVVENLIKEAWDDVEESEYVQNPALVKDVGERLVEELDLLARLMNPKTTYQPDWYDEHDDDQTPLTAILGRSAFAEDYRTHLVEVFELPEEVADSIMEDLGKLVEEQETTITEYYG